MEGLAGVVKRETSIQRDLEGVERQMLGIGKPDQKLGRKRAQLLILISTFGKANIAPSCGIQ